MNATITKLKEQMKTSGKSAHNKLVYKKLSRIFRPLRRVPLKKYTLPELQGAGEAA